MNWADPDGRAAVAAAPALGLRIGGWLGRRYVAPWAGRAIGAAIGSLLVAGDEARMDEQWEEHLRQKAEENQAGPEPQESEQNAGQKYSNKTIDDKRAGHIFGDRDGHVPDTPHNRKRLEDTANDPTSQVGQDEFGNDWATRQEPDGSWTWTKSRGGRIIDGGSNPTWRDPRPGRG